MGAQEVGLQKMVLLVKAAKLWNPFSRDFIFVPFCHCVAEDFFPLSGIPSMAFLSCPMFSLWLLCFYIHILLMCFNVPVLIISHFGGPDEAERWDIQFVTNTQRFLLSRSIQMEIFER